MRTVYLENKFIRFTSSPPSCDGQAIEPTGHLNVAKLLQKLENSKGLYVKSVDPEGSYADFCRFFRIADAGGGVVRNLRGDILVIFRRGMWDLPKGWREQGETYEECALREVSEECGIADLRIGKFLARTEHIYMVGGEWILKRCMWYEILFGGDEMPRPQTEEDITETRWVAPDKIKELIKDSYATIREVLAEIVK